MNTNLERSCEDRISWKQRCSEKMEELKKRESSEEGELLHKELAGDKIFMILELYKAIEEATARVENFVHVLEQVCTSRKLHVCDVFGEVTPAGDSLLHVAASFAREEIAELICDHFPELLIRRNVTGDTALHVAVRLKKSSMVNLILSFKYNDITRQKNEHGDTPLHVAVSSGDLGLVEEIAHADKDVVHFLNKSEQSPLYLAVVSGNVEILNLLLQTPFPSEKPLPTCLGNSPLHAAILEQNRRLIEKILEKRPELVYLRDEDGCTPLHCAAFTDYVEGFCMLLKNSIERSDQTPFIGNKKGNLPIHLACREGHLKIVKKFLHHQWNINPFVLLNQKGRNILHVAAKNGKSDVVLYLLKNWKNNQVTVNEKDNDGNTPLHLASINLFPKTVYYITQDIRTNANLSNNYGLTARDVVHQSLEKMTSTRKILVYWVLKEAGATMKLNMSRSQHYLKPKMELNLRDLLTTYLIVSTLMITVTFAAAFTVPGGVYSFDDPNPKNRGMAVLGHKPLFWVFTGFNSSAMYSSIIACGLDLIALVLYLRVASGGLFLAAYCLSVFFSTVPVAFMAAVCLVVENNTGLTILITLLGTSHTCIILLHLHFACSSVKHRRLIFPKVGTRYFFPVLFSLVDFPDKSHSKIYLDREYILASVKKSLQKN